MCVYIYMYHTYMICACGLRSACLVIYRCLKMRGRVRPSRWTNSCLAASCRTSFAPGIEQVTANFGFDYDGNASLMLSYCWCLVIILLIFAHSSCRNEHLFFKRLNTDVQYKHGPMEPKSWVRSFRPTLKPWALRWISSRSGLRWWHNHLRLGVPGFLWKSSMIFKVLSACWILLAHWSLFRVNTLLPAILCLCFDFDFIRDGLKTFRWTIVLFNNVTGRYKSTH